MERCSDNQGNQGTGLPVSGGGCSPHLCLHFHGSVGHIHTLRHVQGLVKLRVRKSVSVVVSEPTREFVIFKRASPARS